MSITGMIVVLIVIVFAAIAFTMLNYGKVDKEYKRREEYWAKYKKK